MLVLKDIPLAMLVSDLMKLVNTGKYKNLIIISEYRIIVYKNMYM